MKLGYLYRVKKEIIEKDIKEGNLPTRFFCFGNDTGRFIGYTDSKYPWPRFNHGSSESCINCANPDDLLEEVVE